MNIGVLALQGNFSRHAERFRELGATVRIVRSEAEFEALSGFVIPGGESTTMLNLLSGEFRDRLRNAVVQGLPTLATCAGVILLARYVSNPKQESLALLDIDVIRNAYGRQCDSFITRDLRWTTDGDTLFSSIGRGASPQVLRPSLSNIEGVFIRAPRISRLGEGVLSLLEHRGDPVLVQQGSILGSTFHPELSDAPLQSPVYALFLDYVRRFRG